MARSEEMKAKLDELNAKRKNKEISATEYYKGLRSLFVELAQALQEEDIKEEDIKEQIPILKLFLMEQIERMSKRGH